jgi:hypothetical protein
MQLLKEFTVMESQKKASEAIGYAIAAINEVYNEWKKTQRRRNAVNIVTTSVNKLTTIDPATVEHIHDTSKLKLATIIMRCMDIPPWMDVETKRITYRRLYPLIARMQAHNPNTGTNGLLRDVIMTRLSAAVTGCCEDEAEKNVFVAYEPSVSKRYLRYMFGDEMPQNVVKMQTLNLPDDYDTLVNILKINHKKACERCNQRTPNNEQ